MKYYEGSTASTGVISINKAIGSILVVSAKPIGSTCVASVEIERSNGKNFEIVKGAPQPFSKLLRLTKNQGEIVAFEQDKYHYLLELTEDGGSIFLDDKESLKVSLSGLPDGELVSIYGIEEPFFTEAIRVFEEKSLSSEDKERSLVVTGYDFVLVDTENVSEITLQFANGSTVKYDVQEVKSLNVCNSFIQGYDNTLKVVVESSDSVLLPLISVDVITIRKVQGTICNLTLRRG